MTQNQQITNLETKITKIQEIINNWKQELMNYENTLTKIKKEVAELKSNSKNSK